jgi:hypothetical protein
LENVSEEVWSHAEVDGMKIPDMPLYLLVGGNTFSGGEMLAYFLKNTGRAILFGERTGGGAHRTHLVPLPDLGLAFAIPHGTNICPITGTDWENTGVEPDSIVPVNNALEIAHLLILKGIIQREENEGRRYKLRWATYGLGSELKMVDLDLFRPEEYVGSYGPRTISLESGNLYYQREGNPKFRLIPLGDDWFMLDAEELFYFRIEFECDESGSISRLYGRYDTGETDEGFDKEP